MSKPIDPIRCFEGTAKPHEAFWRVRNAAETGGKPELEFYGFISEYSWLEDDITPKKFKDDLYRLGNGGPITVRINSGGGDVIAASVIRAIMTEYPGYITVRIDGLAASAAVIVAMAGKTVRIMDSAYIFIHDPEVMIVLAQLDLEILGIWYNELVSIKKGIVDIYASKTGLKPEKLSKMMADSTWMSAAEAVDFRFADEVIKGGQAPVIDKTIINSLRNYKNIPVDLRRTLLPVPNAELGNHLTPEARRLREEVQSILQK